MVQAASQGLGYGAAEMGRSGVKSSENASLKTAFVGLLGLAVCTALIVVALQVNSQQTAELQSSNTIEFSTGQRAVLSGQDFVPLGAGSHGSHNQQMSAAARRELNGLYAAAGVKMAFTGGARQMELAEVPAHAVAREHTDIDVGSKKRLQAAASNRLNAFARHMPHSFEETRTDKLRKALGTTIAHFFSAQQKH